MSEAPERIWLQSAEDAKHQCEGRMWCEDKVWPENADQHEPTEYVRADIAESDRLAAEVARLREAIAEIQSIAMLAEGNATLSMIGRTARTALASVKE